MNKILIIASHPDDEVLGCGASIKRFSQEGKDVHVYILGEGITSRHSSNGAEVSAEVKALQATSQKVASFLGAKSCRVGDLPDNRFDTLAMLDIVRKIEGVVQELQPDTVFTQDAGDLNIDHAVTFRAALTAVRPIAGSCVKRFFSYEVNSSTDWAFGRFKPVFNPNYFVDVSRFIDSKIEAMKMYVGEDREFPHPRSDKAIMAQAQKLGSVCGCAAAEAFQIIFSII